MCYHGRHAGRLTWASRYRGAHDGGATALIEIMPQLLNLGSLCGRTGCIWLTLPMVHGVRVLGVRWGGILRVFRAQFLFKTLQIETISSFL